MDFEIGSYEAKTKLPELLRGVKLGHRYTIKLRGEAVADLVPSGAAKKKNVSAAVVHMRELMETAPHIAGIDTKALIEEGRD